MVNKALEQVDFISTDDFIAAADVTREVVQIKALGGKSVEVKSLTLREQRDIRKASMKRDKKGQISLDADVYEKGVFILGLVHPSFSDDKFEELLDRNGAAVQEVIGHINRVSKMNDDDDAAEAEVRSAEEKFSH